MTLFLVDASTPCGPGRSMFELEFEFEFELRRAQVAIMKKDCYIE